MEPNQRDTPLRRFNTFWWGLALFVVFGIAIFVIKSIFQSGEMYNADDELGKERIVKREQVEAAQAELLAYKKDGDSVQLPPSALFSMAGEILNMKAADSGIPHNKTFGMKALDQGDTADAATPAEATEAADTTEAEESSETK